MSKLVKSGSYMGIEMDETKTIEENKKLIEAAIEENKKMIKKAQEDHNLVVLSVSIKKASFKNAGRKTRIYVWLEDESVLEQLFARKYRPVALFKKEVLPRATKAIERYIKRELTEAEAKAVWSQRAGCNCGCSPGFILGLTGLEVHIRVQSRVGFEEKINKAEQE